MVNRRTTLLTFITATLFTLSLAASASAQGRDPRWGRDDDYQRDRDRDRRRHDDDDDYYDRGRYGYGRYDERELRNVAQRLKDASHQFERDVDRLLDNSRIDGTNREDHVNDDVKEFRRAADQFKSRVGNGRDLNRSAGEARQLLSASEHVERMLSRIRTDSRANADWREIQRDLRYVADIYGLSYRGYDDGYGRRGSYDPRYPNDYPNDRNRRRDDGWWRRIPDVINGRRP